jgi:hypothetical protein
MPTKPALSFSEDESDDGSGTSPSKRKRPTSTDEEVVEEKHAEQTPSKNPVSQASKPACEDDDEEEKKATLPPVDEHFSRPDLNQKPTEISETDFDVILLCKGVTGISMPKLNERNFTHTVVRLTDTVTFSEKLV